MNHDHVFKDEKRSGSFYKGKDNNFLTLLDYSEKPIRDYHFKQIPSSKDISVTKLKALGIY